MSSWYNNLLTKTSSQISNLRSTYLAGDADGDTDDDTHVCRVLRGYYGEKGRPFPSWLPPDPKASAPTPQPVLVNNQVGARYGGLGPGGQNQQQQPGGGLSSLWDSNASAAPPPQPQSLRAGRTPASLQAGAGDISRRPLPGQRAASNQSNVSSYGGRSDAATAPPAAAAGGGRSAQDLLRQRLWGGSRTTSPSQQGGNQGPFAPPAGSGGGGGGGGGGNYEDRFAPTGAYDGASGGGNDRPVMSANAPWSSGGDDYYGGGGGSGGGGGGGGGRAQRRQGLPSGPRGYR